MDCVFRIQKTGNCILSLLKHKLQITNYSLHEWNCHLNPSSLGFSSLLASSDWRSFITNPGTTKLAIQ